MKAALLHGLRRAAAPLDRLPGGPAQFFVWLAAAGAAGLILADRVARVEYVGLVRSVEYEISAPRLGRVTDVLVELYEQVEEDQVVTVLEVSPATAPAPDGALSGPLERLELRSPVAGSIRTLPARVGETVIGGQAVATVGPREADEVVAYVPERDGRRVEQLDPVLVVAGRSKLTVAESFVAQVSPAIEQLPQRLWGALTTPEYGRAFVVRLGSDLRLPPGERVRVRFTDAR